MVVVQWTIQTRTGLWLRAIIWLNCLIGGCAMIPPLANIVEIPTAVTLVSGKDSRNHLNRMLTVDVQ